jgi:hypothetical protein
LSKDSADAATAGFILVHSILSKRSGGERESQCVVREKAKSGINTVTEVLLSLYFAMFIF